MTKSSGGVWRLIRLSAAHHRSAATDLLLASVLSLVAGATNLGGLFAIGHFASHMTGYLSYLADGLITAQIGLVALSVLALGVFFVGGTVATLALHWMEVHHPKWRVSVLVLAQAGVLMACALVAEETEAIDLALLCFAMGLQNAMMTKVTNFEIRTTHMTGIMTDVGIHAGRALAARALRDPARAPDPRRAVVLWCIIAMFVVGGILGSVLYHIMGQAFTLPLALVLLALAAPACARSWRGRA